MNMEILRRVYLKLTGNIYISDSEIFRFFLFFIDSIERKKNFGLQTCHLRDQSSIKDRILSILSHNLYSIRNKAKKRRGNT
jgi:hypothetical protein